MKSPTDLDLGNPIRTAAIRELDPLAADLACFTLRRQNADVDLPAMTGALRALTPTVERVDTFSTEECVAAMRDLGMFLGSIRRHGAEPLELVPAATPVLHELGRRTDMVPRDTVHHYCTWNPVGDRQRMYTGDVQEAYLQESVRMVFPHLREGLELASRLSDLALEDAKFAQLTDELTGHTETMVQSIDMVVSHVSPEFFARTLRPYFEEITVDGRVLLGPAAAQVPLWLIDQAIWASDRSEPEYSEFLRDSIPYSLRRWRELYAHWDRIPSVVSRLVDSFGADAEEAVRRAPALRASAEALARLLRVIVVFRGRHLGIAKKAYDADLRLYPLGSGGASVELLKQIVDLTRATSQLTRPGARGHGHGAAHGGERRSA
ncbi:monodechloroaminopyrrolnitrin synthase PrnB family protein [Streptomyces coelicoflavus]|uniref:monodechloroaminopyrrolnitrin synthase PrnB family protein n=1 Tax=Streptomyces coelicoflavus TaxID=285562 RepID=UPI000D59FFC1|nr:monodechloroaminopyrrolnitrin synthase PrnB family protein [Streptomyces coelicoflavus]